jgi:hypothetical protein
MRVTETEAMRSLLTVPNWDGKIVLATVFTVGYFFIVYSLIHMTKLEDNQKEIATIALAALGPQLGQIFAAIYRTTLSDERDSARRNETLKTAIVTPSAPTNDNSGDLGDQVREGAEEGSRDGVAAGLTGTNGGKRDVD